MKKTKKSVKLILSIIFVLSSIFFLTSCSAEGDAHIKELASCKELDISAIKKVGDSFLPDIEKDNYHYTLSVPFSEAIEQLGENYYAVESIDTNYKFTKESDYSKYVLCIMNLKLDSGETLEIQMNFSVYGDGDSGIFPPELCECKMNGVQYVPSEVFDSLFEDVITSVS